MRGKSAAAELVESCARAEPTHRVQRAVHAATTEYGRAPRSYQYVEELLAAKDLDAVVISTADFQHAPLLLMAAEASKDAKAFALGDALGDRDLPRALRRLDEELWELQFDKDKSEIGLLYGLISKVRAMILLKEMLREGWIKPGVRSTKP